DMQVICSESREQVEENLERWRFALERRGMKVSRSKTEYMCVNEREGSGTVRLQGEEVKKVQEFKYLGSTVQSNGECRKEVKKRVQAGWNGWRKVSGVLCDQKISARIKGKVYRTVVRPAMLYGLETVSLRKRQESELEVAELKMLRFSLGVTRLDRIRNEYIRGTAHVGRLGDKVREARLRWFGHVQRRESEYIGRRTLDMELPGRRQRGRPKRSSAYGSGHGSLQQNTSPLMDPAELREIIVRQGAIIRSYQDQVEVLQSQLSGTSIAAPLNPPSARALIDSVAAMNLIDGALVEELRIPTFPCIPSLRITAIDSQSIGEGYLKRQTELLDFQGCLRDPVPRPCRTSHVDRATPAAHRHLPHPYTDFVEVFSEEGAARLPSHQVWDCAIDLLPNTSLPKGWIYPLSLLESKAIEDYIETSLAAGHIRPSTSPAVAGFFFVGKRDGGLWPCIDYRGLNGITVRYPYPLPRYPRRWSS
ncbi:hypothetical protein QTP70_000703, partial [Hemibagrus guttatus]